MLNLVQLMALDDGCGGLLPVVKILRNGVFPIVFIGIPILFLIFAVVDLGKAVIASDEKEVKQAQSRLIKRAIYTAAVFLVIPLVSLVMDIVGKGETGNTTGWYDCWQAAGK